MREFIYALLGVPEPAYHCPTCKNELSKENKCINKECRERMNLGFRFNWCDACQLVVPGRHKCKVHKDKNYPDASVSLHYRIWVKIDNLKVYQVVNRTMSHELRLGCAEDYVEEHLLDYHPSRRNKQLTDWITNNFFEREVETVPDSANCGAGFQHLLALIKMIENGEYIYRKTFYKCKPNFTEIGFERLWY